MSLDPRRFGSREFKNHTWSVTVPAEVKPEDLLNPAYFANVAKDLRQYDRICVTVDTGEWYAEFLVVSCARSWAKLHPILKLDLVGKEGALTEMDDDSSNQFEVKHRGAHLKWCVIRKSDKEAIKEGCESKQEAANWLASYVMTM